jgi:hypothetical protein
MSEVRISFTGDEAVVAPLVIYLESASGVLGISDLTVNPVVAKPAYIPAAELSEFIDGVNQDSLTGMGTRVTRALTRNYKFRDIRTAAAPLSKVCYLPDDLPEGEEAVIGSGDSSEYHELYLKFAARGEHLIRNLGEKGMGFITLFLDSRTAETATPHTAGE